MLIEITEGHLEAVRNHRPIVGVVLNREAYRTIVKEGVKAKPWEGTSCLDGVKFWISDTQPEPYKVFTEQAELDVVLMKLGAQR